VGATLALTQSRDDRFRDRQAQKLEATETLERNDLATRESIDRLLERGGTLGVHAPLLVEERKRRTAARAGDRLRVVPAVVEVSVFTRAFAAHRECAHRRASTVVREAQADREARAAGDTVREGVGVAAVAGVVHFSPAIRAGPQVWREHGRDRGATLARHDLERVRGHGVAVLRDCRHLDALDDRRRRLLTL